MKRSYPIDNVVSHKRGHLDEVATHILLQLHGEERFPGVAQAVLLEYDPAIHDDGRSEEDWLNEGYLFLGVRGGMFDDHPHSEHKEDCVYTKVLRYLQLDDPALKQIGQEVLHEDRYGSQSRLHVGSLLKDMMRWGMEDEAYQYVREMIFNAHYKSQCAFQKTLALVRSKAHYRDVVNESTEDVLRVVWIDGCDDEDFSRASRSKKGLTASLVIHRNSNGLNYISCNKAQGIKDLRRLAAAIRELEMGYTWFDIEDDIDVGCDGSLCGWYHQRQAGAIYNGSLAHDYVSPSNIPLEKLVREGVKFLGSYRLTGRRRGVIQ